MHPPPAPLPLVVMTFATRLVAVNAHTGQRVWECPAETSTSGRIFVDQGLVFYVAGGAILCADYLTGAPRWKVPHGFVAEVVVLVFAGCVLVSAMGEVRCFNAQTGAVLWHDPFKGYGSTGGAMAAPGVHAQIDRH